jgi:hypothetical protein
MKDPDRDYSEYSGTESTATRMAINILGNGHSGVPLAGPVKIPNDQLYSGDYTDMHVATKIGLTNNGYIYNDYSRDYSPPNSMRTNSTSLKNHLLASSGHSPHITPVNGGIDHYSLGRNRELRQDNGLPSIPLNTMPNGMLSKYYTLEKSCCCDRVKEKYLTQTTSILDQSLLNNVDIRYSATYGNPFLKSSSITPLPPPNAANSQKPFTANPSVTPAPPPYNRSNNSNSSFSSSTTASNNGSLLGAGGANIGLSYANPNINSSTAVPMTATTNSLTQITSPSRQFILPANGDLKKGSLATHV